MTKEQEVIRVRNALADQPLDETELMFVAKWLVDVCTVPQAPKVPAVDGK